MFGIRLTTGWGYSILLGFSGALKYLLLSGAIYAKILFLRVLHSQLYPKLYWFRFLIILQLSTSVEVVDYRALSVITT